MAVRENIARKLLNKVDKSCFLLYLYNMESLEHLCESLANDISEVNTKNLFSYMSQTLNKIDKNLIDAKESVKRIEKKLEKMEINGSHTRNP